MKIHLVAAVCTFALMGTMPAHAADTHVKADAKASTAPGLTEDINRAWEDTKDTVSEAAKNTSEAVGNTYENIKAAVVDDGKGTNTSVTIDSRMTAAGMIGKPVYNAKNEKIATVKDIIINPDGEATTVIVADGVFGFGRKLAAFDYDLVSQRQKDGDVMMPLSEETIKKAAEFSYDRKDAAKDNVRVIPEGSLSVATLLNGQLVNQNNETIAQVDNIAFRNGAVSQVIVAFDQTLGIGGKKAVVPYNDLKVLQQGKNTHNVDFQMSAAQATQFETFKKTATN
jgi:sporulation protein YlmC with PRC-barrel domain